MARNAKAALKMFDDTLVRNIDVVKHANKFIELIMNVESNNEEIFK